MAKKTILFLISILLCNSLLSQQSNDDIIIPDNDSHLNFTIAVGPQVGLGLVNGTTTSYGFGFDIGPAFQLGASGRLHFGQRNESSPIGTGLFGVEAELLYERRKTGTDYGSITMQCIEIPVMFQYYPVSSMASEFALEAGMTYVKVFKCSPEQLQCNNIILHSGQLSSSDVMVSLGACYQTPFNVVLHLRYNIGTMALAGNLDSKINTFIASAVYSFDL